MASGAQPSSADVYSAVATDVLTVLLGASGAKAVIHYTGKPDPSTFESNLRKVFGSGANPILKRIRDRLEEWGAEPDS